MLYFLLNIYLFIYIIYLMFLFHNCRCIIVKAKMIKGLKCYRIV